MTGPEHASDQVSAMLRQARKDLLAGRGPGASDEEVAAHTRNRVMISGLPATRRLELAARDTARARRDAAGLDDTIQIVSTELAHTLNQLSERLRPGPIASKAVTGAVARVRAHPALFVVVIGAAVILRARSSARDPLRPAPTG